mgnify:CR=1 FL=1
MSRLFRPIAAWDTHQKRKTTINNTSASTAPPRRMTLSGALPQRLHWIANSNGEEQASTELCRTNDLVNALTQVGRKRTLAREGSIPRGFLERGSNYLVAGYLGSQEG